VAFIGKNLQKIKISPVLFHSISV